MKGIQKIKKKSLIETRYYPFGNFILNHFQLNNNILLVKYPQTLAPVAKIKSTQITDDFKILLIDLIDTGKINIDLQKKLGDIETNIFELLLLMAGLKVHLNYKRQVRSIDDYIHRFNILRGSLVAGDDSVELRTELTEIIKLLNNKAINKISDDVAFELLNILK